MMAERKGPPVGIPPPAGMMQKKQAVNREPQWTKTVLIVSSLFFPFVDWIDDKTVKKVLLTTTAVKQSIDPGSLKAFAVVEAFENFGINALVEYRAFQLNKTHKFTHVVCLSEEDMIRSAQLREAFGLKTGQSLASTLLFRDKVLMKQAVEAAGCKVPRFAPVESSLDLVQFVEKFGLPVVVKPRKGYGSVNTTVIKTSEQLESFLTAGLTVATDGPLEMMVESFVTGHMYHVDGYVYEGKSRVLWPSSYVGTVVDYNANDFIAAFSLLPSNPLTRHIQDFVEKTNIALAAHGPSSFPFHCEVWVTPEDEIVFCENASRAGGGGIAAEVSALFGVTLRKKHLQFQLGVPLTAESDLIPYEERKPDLPDSVAWLYIYAKEGKVTLPSSCMEPWCLFYEPYYQSGSIHTSRKSCGDAICEIIVSGSDEQVIKKNIVLAHEWFASHTTYEPVSSSSTN